MPPRPNPLRARLSALALAIAGLALAVPGTASAACTHPPSAYDSGGSPGSGAVNDPLFPRQWGLEQIKAPAAWQRGARGAGVKIAVVDTGADFSHPDLAAKLDPGTDLVRFIAPSAADPGLTGPGCPGAEDENGHGTHVAGIAAAITNNGKGVAGTAPDARILPVRVLDANGSGEPAAVNAGIRWAADHGAKVINLSLGPDTPLVGNLPDQDTENAVAYAYAKGAVVVAAAGNESFPACDYPAAAKNAVCVGATDRTGGPAAYSNFPSSPGDTVPVRAPGGTTGFFCEDDLDIWSTIWPDSSDDCKGSGSIAGYETLTGTSMATPFVSGVAAILAGRGLSNGQILQCLKTKSSNGGSYDPAFGYGIVDADTATAGCSASSTPSFTGGGGGGGGGPAKKHHVTVTVKRTTRKKLIHSGRLRVFVRSDRAAKVKLRAVVRRGKSSKTGARRTVRLKKAGTRKTTLKLSHRARKRLKKSKKATVQIRYRSGSESGIASARR
jgi:serine protease